MGDMGIGSAVSPHGFAPTSDEQKLLQNQPHLSAEERKSGIAKLKQEIADVKPSQPRTDSQDGHKEERLKELNLQLKALQITDLQASIEELNAKRPANRMEAEEKGQDLAALHNELNTLLHPPTESHDAFKPAADKNPMVELCFSGTDELKKKMDAEPDPRKKLALEQEYIKALGGCVDEAKKLKDMEGSILGNFRG